MYKVTKLILYECYKYTTESANNLNKDSSNGLFTLAYSGTGTGISTIGNNRVPVPV